MEAAGIYKEIINKSIGRISIIAVPLFFAISELIHPITQNTILGEIKSAKDNSLSWLISHIGIIGVTGLLAYDFILWDAWKAGSDEIVGKYLEILNTSVFGMLFLLSGPVLFLLGFLTLVILMLKSTKIKRWKSILVLSGLLIYGLAGPLIPISNGHILVSIGALIMLFGFTEILFEDIKESTIKKKCKNLENMNL